MKLTIHQTSRHGSRPYNQDRLAYSYSKDTLLLVVWQMAWAGTGMARLRRSWRLNP